MLIPREREYPSEREVPMKYFRKHFFFAVRGEKPILGYKEEKVEISSRNKIGFSVKIPLRMVVSLFFSTSVERLSIPFRRIRCVNQIHQEHPIDDGDLARKSNGSGYREKSGYHESVHLGK